MTISSPIVYIIFNRPRHTRETFAVIEKLQPTSLLIIADGPRPGHPTDVQRCHEVREIVELINWPCEVHRNYADENLGCRHRVTTGLDWAFSIVDRAIILEDDCLPHSDFFVFCANLLEKYQHDERVFVVTGNNFQRGRKRGSASYYFSKYNHVWGWATWRRAWLKNSKQLSFWPEWKKSEEWKKHTPDRIERTYWNDIFDRMYRNEIDTWDYTWMASVWFHNGLTATPNVNLVTNIGFGPEATHTVSGEDQEGSPTYPVGLLVHPVNVRQNKRADRYVFDSLLGGRDKRYDRRLFRCAKGVVKKFLQFLGINLNGPT